MGLWQTWKKTVLEPERFWSSVEPGGTSSDALYYGWLLTVVGSVPTTLVNLVNFKSLQAQFQQLTSKMNDVPTEFGKALDTVAAHSGAFAIGLGVFSIVIYPVSLLIGAAVVHLGCLMFGAGRNGFGATLRVVAYASAPAALAWIPMVGFAAAIYALVLEVWGIARVQDTSAGRAIGGVLALPLLLGCCACGLAFAAAVAVVGAMR